MSGDLASRLVQAAAAEISEVDGHASSVEPCGDATYPQMARAAVAATIRVLVDCRALTADFRALADTVEKGEQR